MGVVERRTRLSVRHHLAESAQADTPSSVARDLVALHGTDPASVFLSIVARAPDSTVSAIEDALYVKRELVRMLGMRRTVFVVPDELAPVVQAACTRARALQLRRHYQQILREVGGIQDAEDWWA